MILGGVFQEHKKSEAYNLLKELLYTSTGETYIKQLITLFAWLTYKFVLNEGDIGAY